MEDPNDFFCDYNDVTGVLTHDNDAGFCPANAVGGTGMGSPTIETNATENAATVGDSISDSATVTGGVSPTGTVTFVLYDNSSGSGTVLFTDPDEPLSGGAATSTSYGTIATGTDYWVATYNGDANNNPMTSGPSDEPVAISAAAPAIDTDQSVATATVGDSISDLAAVSGGFSPTGTVTFNLYDNSSATGPALFTDSDEPLSGGGTATSADYVTTASGTDYWVATYNGDPNNAGVSSGDALEPVTISPAPTTYLCPSEELGDYPLGYHDSGSNPIFCSYPSFASESINDYFCTYDPSTGALITDGDIGGCPTTATPGAALASPSIGTTQQPASTTAGSSIADQVTVSGGNSPGGTVVFNLYNNSGGTGTPLFTDVETLSGGAATSSGYPTTAVGTDYWVATYFGDDNNNGVISSTSAEPVTLTIATPSINTTQQPSSATVGTSFADKATLTGGAVPTGTVTFKLYDNSSASGSALFTDTESLSAGSATSATYTPTATGTYYWVATYSGDPNNNSVSSTDSGEPVKVTPLPAGQPVPPTIVVTSNANPSTPGGQVTFTATLSPAPGCGSVSWLINGAPPASGTPTGGTGSTFTLGPISSMPLGASPVTAVFSGCANAGPATGTLIEQVITTPPPPPGVTNPTITATLTSAHHKTHGWYRSPVTISFTCVAGSTPLRPACPSPVKLTASKAAQSVTESITDTDGGTASITVTGINIDRNSPTLDVTGATDGHTYKHGRHLACHGTDPLSGIASCVITKHRHKNGGKTVVDWTAVATDNAGNTTTAHGHYKITG